MNCLSTIIGDPATSAIIQIAVLAVLAWTLHVLIGYARDTGTIARAAIEQRNLTHCPCVVVRDLLPGLADAKVFAMTIASAAGGATKVVTQRAESRVLREERLVNVRFPSSFQIENCGVGPALSIEARVRVEDGAVRLTRFFPHLRAGQISEKEIAFQKEDGSWTVEFEYSGLSGARFVSVYSMKGESVEVFAVRRAPALVKEQVTA